MNIILKNDIIDIAELISRLKERKRLMLLNHQHLNNFEQRICELRNLSKEEDEMFSEYSVCFAYQFFKESLEKGLLIQYPFIGTSMNGEINFIWEKRKVEQAFILNASIRFPFSGFIYETKRKNFMEQLTKKEYGSFWKHVLIWNLSKNSKNITSNIME